MRNILLISIFFFIPSFCIAGECDTSFQKIRERYSDLRGIKIQYRRYIISKTMSMLGEGVESDIAEGEILLSPPYNLRLEQKIPSHEFIISDGKTIWWYIPKDRIAHKYKAGSFGKELSIIRSIFTGMKEIEKGFFLRCNDSDKLILIPKEKWQDIEKIEIVLSKGYRIRKVKIYNILGSVTCFEIKKEKFVSINKNLFQFIPPPDVRIIQEK